MLTLGRRNDAEVVRGNDVAGRKDERGTISCFGLLQAAGFVMRYCLDNEAVEFVLSWYGGHLFGMPPALSRVRPSLRLPQFLNAICSAGATWAANSSTECSISSSLRLPKQNCPTI